MSAKQTKGFPFPEEKVAAVRLTEGLYEPSSFISPYGIFAVEYILRLTGLTPQSLRDSSPFRGAEKEVLIYPML